MSPDTPAAPTDPASLSRPTPRFLAGLIGVAAVILGVGASLRPPTKQAKTTAVPSNELATLPERSQRRALRDMAEYVAERSRTVGASVVYVPELQSSALTMTRDSVLTVVAAPDPDTGAAAGTVRVLLSAATPDDSARPAAPILAADTLPPRWSLVVARAPDGRTLSLAGMTGGLIEAQCGDLGFRELVFDALVPLAFRGGGVFDLDGNVMAQAVPCAGRIALVPMTDITRGLERQRTTGYQLWFRYGVRVRAADSLSADLLGSGRGVVVTELRVGSAAHQAGLQPGDVVIRLGSRPVAGEQDLEPLLELKDGRALTRRRSGSGIVLDTSDSVQRALRVQRPQGIRLDSVPQGSRAERAGLHPGDLILRIGRSAPTPAALRRVLADTGRVFLVYQRGGRQHGVVLQ